MKALTILKNVLGVVWLMTFALLIIVIVGTSCSSMKKNKRSIDSVSHQSLDSMTVRTDKGTVSDLKEGEYERVTVELTNKEDAKKFLSGKNVEPGQSYHIPDSIMRQLQNEFIYGEPDLTPSTMGAVKITYERGKTKEQHIEVKDKKDSAVRKSQNDTKVHATQKNVDKSSFPWFQVILALLIPVVLFLGYRFWKYGRWV